MIVREFFRTRMDGVNLYRTYSDKNKRIRNVDTDELFDDVINVEQAPYKYVETNIEIENYEEYLDEPIP